MTAAERRQGRARSLVLFPGYGERLRMRQIKADELPKMAKTNRSRRIREYRQKTSCEVALCSPMSNRTMVYDLRKMEMREEIAEIQNMDKTVSRYLFAF